MGEILSQDEIDALLNALSTDESKSSDSKKGDDSHKKVRVYDFKRPNKFSKEQIHTIQAIHENYARIVTNFFSAHLRTLVQMNVHAVEQLTYDEFIKSMPNPTIMNIFQVDPLDGNAILEINPGLAFGILDRLFGGQGEAPDKIRGLTDIERTVLEKVVNRTLALLAEAWENIIQFKPKLDIIETNPLFTQIVSPSEMVVLVTFHTTIGENEGLMNLCLPFIVLEPIISKLSAHFWFAGTAKAQTAENMANLRKRIEKARVNLSAILGQTYISLGELLELQAGDVIQLDTSVHHHLPLMVGTKQKFMCRPGAVGSKLGVEITSVIKEGDEEDE